MAVPALLGAATGNLSAGFCVSIGAFIVGGVDSSSSMKAQVGTLVAALVPTFLAVLAATLVTGHAWLTDAAVVLLVCLAAIAGSYSRAMVAATTRFITLFVIMVNFTDSTGGRPGFLILLAAGAAFAIALNLVFGALARAYRQGESMGIEGSRSTATAAQKFAHWKKSVKHLAGWQYALRLGICLSAAAWLRSIWPDHHLYWTALTVVLLCQRQIEKLPVKTTQRALGTALGVVVASLLIANGLADWVIVIGFGLLAFVRPFLRVRNYLACSAVMTPLVVLMMDVGHPVGMSVISDRLLATLIGGALVVAVNLLFSKIPRNPGEANDRHA